MPAILTLSFVLAGTIIIVWMLASNKKPNPEAKKIIEEAELKIKVLRTLSECGEISTKGATPSIPKIRLLEKLNIKPNILKSCLQQLINEEIISSSDDTVKLTKFGDQYYKNFIKSKRG